MRPSFGEKFLIIVFCALALGAARYRPAHAQGGGTWEQVDPRGEVDGYPDGEECDVVEPETEEPEEPGLEDCCNYCVRFLESGIYISGTISCAGCENCERPTVWESWNITKWIAWAVCKLYFKVACPIACFLSGWLDAMVQWFKSWGGWLGDLVTQILAVIWLAVQLIISMFLLIVDIVLLGMKVTGQIFGALGAVIGAIFGAEAETVSLPGAADPDWALLWCIWGEFEWAINNSRMKLWFYNIVIQIILNNFMWTMKYWTSPQEATERPAVETTVVR